MSQIPKRVKNHVEDCTVIQIIFVSLQKSSEMTYNRPTPADLQLSEEDIKLRYITPAIRDKEWSFDDISMEARVQLTDGRINLRGNLVARGKAKYADYMLYYNRATPIAIVEAKDAS